MASNSVPIQRKDLHCLVEVFQSETAESPMSFAFTVFAYVDDDDNAYFGEVSIRKKELTPELFRKHLKPIPDEDVYPPASSCTTIAVNSRESFHIKRPKFTNYDRMRGTGSMATLLLQEVETFEFLKNHPHPHIVNYQGCVVKRNRIVGIALQRYQETLEDRLKDRERPFDSEHCFDTIVSAVKHLHSLGFAHNDLCPMNIMLDENDKTYLIDLGSCQQFGKPLVTAGTPGWMEDYFTTSEKRHDEYSLEKIRSWLADNQPALSAG